MSQYQICRICLADGVPLQNIFSSSIDERFTWMTGIKISKIDDLKWICNYCLHFINKFHKFREKCIRIHLFLMNKLVKVQNGTEDFSELRKIESKNTFSLSRSNVVFVDNLLPLENHCTIPHESTTKNMGQFRFEEVKLECDYNQFDMNNVHEDALFDDEKKNLENDFEKTSINLSSELSQNDQEDNYYDEITESKTASQNIKMKKPKVKNTKVSIENSDIHVKKNHSRMILETDKYKVIKLSRDEILKEMEECSKSEKYLNLPYKCSVCVKGFSFEDVHLKHMTIHDPKNGNFECDVCHQYLPTRDSMRRHWRSHSTKYECKKCGAVRCSPQHILEHHMLEHEEFHKVYVCDFCGKTMNARTNFQKHVQIHYRANIACEKCGKLFKSIAILRNHMLRHGDVKRFRCDQCPKAYECYSALYSHRITHIKTKNFYCVECDLYFKTRYYLNVHLRTSVKHVAADRLKYPCGSCEKSFASRKTLHAHIEWAHYGKKNFKCSKCGSDFATSVGLRSHTKKIHEAPPQCAEPRRTHVCNVCNKSYVSNTVLKKHRRIHTGERPYECGECGKKFTQQSTLTTHVRLVHLKVSRKVKGEKMQMADKSSNKDSDNMSVLETPPPINAEYNFHLAPSVGNTSSVAVAFMPLHI